MKEHACSLVSVTDNDIHTSGRLTLQSKSPHLQNAFGIERDNNVQNVRVGGSSNILDRESGWGIGVRVIDGEELFAVLADFPQGIYLLSGVHTEMVLRSRGGVGNGITVGGSVSMCGD